MNSQRWIVLLFTTSICLTLSLQAVRLRFILENNTGANLFACLRTHDSNPLNEAEMRPGERENIYTESFKKGITRFIFKLETNNEVTNYEVVYNSQAKMLQLQREGIVFDETSYNADKAEYPPVILIDKKLDAYFDNESIYNNEKVTGRNTPNSVGYKPSLYLGDSGPKELRRDQNRFCPKHSKCRNDLARLSAYVGECNHQKPHDNLNPFCKKKKICWRDKRFEYCSKEKIITVVTPSVTPRKRVIPANCAKIRKNGVKGCTQTGRVKQRREVIKQRNA